MKMLSALAAVVPKASKTAVDRGAMRLRIMLRLPVSLQNEAMLLTLYANIKRNTFLWLAPRGVSDPLRRDFGGKQEVGATPIPIHA